ncbi:unnamed protein product [Parnassius apollo]|uniref:(apollo) hypothetical protein n=1 Tax=Parnassius apollo TaxID=110799 RepID=A0A8S3WCX0_PARAO|nr:unnamed protein product [Parnassius apollo]
MLLTTAIPKHCSEEKRMVYKRLRRACALACDVPKVGNMIEVDAMLPLGFLSLVATYTIVLLQFAFL